MRSFFGPLHLLFFAESFAHHFVHRRLDKSRCDRLTVTIALSVIRDHMPVVHDVGAQFRQRLDQLHEPGIGLTEGLDRGLHHAILPHAFSPLPCHSDHFSPSIWSCICSPNTASHCTRPLPYWPNTVSFIVRRCQSKICVALGLISNWSCRSVSSPSERKVISWFIWKSCECNTSYRRRCDLVSRVCTNPKRLSEGVLSSSSSSKLRILLPTMTSNLCFLSNKWPTSHTNTP